MKTKHTPEPWRVFKSEQVYIHGIDGKNQESVMVFLTEIEAEEIGSLLPQERQNANISRIVDCVNACAGMEDPAAEIAALRQRISELESQPKRPEPNWDEAPEWAMWWAVDADGEACFFEAEPVRDDMIWDNRGKWDCAGEVNLSNLDWRETLTKRPE